MEMILTIIIAALLGLLLIYIIPKYFRFFHGSNTSPKKMKYIIKSQISIKQDQNDNEFLDQQDNYDSPKEGYVQLILQNYEYQNLKITTQSILYEQQQVISKNKVIKTLEYQYKLDNQFNQSYRCIEQEKNQIIIYNQNTKENYYKGIIENAPKDIYFGLEDINRQNLANYYFNQLITKDELREGSSTIIDAFSQYLNLESLKQYIRDNKNHIQTYKQNIFFPSSILKKGRDVKQFKQQYENYIFQYQPIKYDLSLIYDKIFFITSYEENKDYFFIEVSPPHLYIHDLKDQNKGGYDYSPYLNLLKSIYPSLGSEIIKCAECKLNQRLTKSYFHVCYNMLKESKNKKLLSKIQSMEQLQEHLQSLIKL
ncbi:unnamed protein product [Paramecium primaurelia]|uniref:Uncharacterized protein n=1 Tax=Paramecium primaurelia TaxID=5886 RepID=A0A8S1NNU6_PARPR|nr:unnamed protein product [Paramecium primaurelia]